MSAVRFRPVSYSELSALRHEIEISDCPSSLSPEFVVVRYFGSYRDGGAGYPDALYIIATSAAALEAWWSDSIILDFRSLQYEWGDNMRWVAEIGSDPRLPRHRHRPLAIVVGDGCRAALQSMWTDKYHDWCVESIEEAIELCRRKAREQQEAVKRMNEDCPRIVVRE
jgi:hypothetical protein